MAYRLLRSPHFLADVEELGRYCGAYHPDFANEQFERLNFTLETLIADAPMTWSWSIHTGAPYRAYLFRVGPRTQFWIVYTVDEKNRTVNLLRLWGAARNPRQFYI